MLLEATVGSKTEPGNNYRNNPRGKNSDENTRRAQAELMWNDRVEGMSNKKIAEKYDVGVRTVTNRFAEFPREGYDRTLHTTRNGVAEAEREEIQSEVARMWDDKVNEGLSNQQLAEKYGISLRSVFRRLEGYFPERPQLALEVHRQRETDKLDMYEEILMKELNKTHLVVDKGAVVHYQRKPLEDSAPKFAAIRELLKLADRRAKLHGIDSPLKAEVTHNTGVEIQVTELQDLVDEAKRKQYDQEKEIRKALGYEIIDAEVVEETGGDSEEYLEGSD